MKFQQEENFVPTTEASIGRPEVASPVWMFQTPPKEFDAWLDEVVSDPESSPMLSVNRNAKEIEIGHPIWLWVSGPEAGIYGTALVASLPSVREEMTRYGGASSKSDRPWVDVQVLSIFESPLLKRDLLSGEDGQLFEALSVVRMPRGGTVHKVTPDQDLAIREKLKEQGESPWPPVPPPKFLNGTAQALSSGELSDQTAQTFGIGVTWVEHLLRTAGLPVHLEIFSDQTEAEEGGFWGTGIETFGRCAVFNVAGEVGNLWISLQEAGVVWGFNAPWADGGQVEVDFAKQLSKTSRQEAVWKVLETARPGLEWFSYGQDSHTGGISENVEMAQRFPMAGNLGTWVTWVFPAVRASILYEESGAIHSPDLWSWIAADLSRLGVLLSVTSDIPIRCLPLEYPARTVDPNRVEPLVFISYRRSDNTQGLISNLRDDLDGRYPGRVFLDDGIRTGSRWRSALKARLDECAILVVAVSDAAFESEEIQWEFETVADRISGENPSPGAIIPIRVRESDFDLGEPSNDAWWGRLTEYQAPPGSLEGGELESIVEAVAMAYREVRSDVERYVSDRLATTVDDHEDWPTVSTTIDPLKHLLQVDSGVIEKRIISPKFDDYLKGFEEFQRNSQAELAREELPPPPPSNPPENGPAPVPEAGWYRDPLDPTKSRYWSGTKWTDHVS